MKLKALKRISRYIVPDRCILAAGIFFSLLTNLSAIIIPSRFSVMIDRYIPDGNLSGMFVIGLQLLGLAAVSCTTQYLAHRMTRTAKYNLQYRLREQIHHGLMDSSYSRFGTLGYGQINTNLIQDVENFCSEIYDRALGSVSNLLFFVICFVLLAMADPGLTVLLFAFLLTVNSYIGILKRRMSYRQKRYLQEREKLNSLLATLSRNYKTITIYNQKQMWIWKVRNTNAEMIQEWLRLNIFSPLIQSSIEIAVLLSYLLVFGIGWLGLKGGQISLGTLFLYLTYIPQLWNRYSSVSNISVALSQAVAYADRIEAVALDRAEMEEFIISERAGKETGQWAECGQIQISHLTFSYREEQPIWKDFSVVWEGPGVYVLQGPSGCGKSTLFDLILGLYAGKGGEIQICGRTQKEYGEEEWKNTFGIVHQDSYFFRGSIWDNIRFFEEEIEDQIIENCLIKYDLYETLLPWKNSVLERDDERLTVGQRRIVALARVLVRNPKIYLFDEVTAGLDSYTENKVLEVIEQIGREHLCIMISHKESDKRIAKSVVACAAVAAGRE